MARAETDKSRNNNRSSALLPSVNTARLHPRRSHDHGDREDGQRTTTNGGKEFRQHPTINSTMSRVEVEDDNGRNKTVMGRFFRFIKHEFSRPSLLSSSDSNESDVSPDPFGSASQGTKDAARRLGVGSTGKLKRRNTRRAASSTGLVTMGEDGDEKDDKDEPVPVSMVVIDRELDYEEEAGPNVSGEAGGGMDGMARRASAESGSWARSDGKVSPRSKTSGTEALTGRMMSKVKAMWVLTYYFFDSSFAERTKERAYQRERFYGLRQLAIAASAFFLLLWVFVVCLTPRPWRLYDEYALIGIYGFFSIFTLPFVCFNVPYRAPWFWQIWISLSAWSLPELGIVSIKLCSYLEYEDPAKSNCGTQTEFIVFASAVGQATLALFALHQNRFTAMVMSLQFFGIVGGFFFPMGVKGVARDTVYFLCYHVFIIVISFIMERSSRQHFELREQLKLQYRATQRAQVLEKKASDLTKRFVSYIFHEVRVPLNTALLAVQNLEGESLFDSYTPDQTEMVHGLTGSLSMMEKVLNDVLSFNRMEAGTFTQAKVPFDLHKSIQLTALSHSSPAHMKGIELKTELDPRIDQLGCWFIGDEMRLRQITSNLVSNSIKFTQEGSVRLVTKLLYPKVDLEAQKAIAGDPEKGDADAESKRFTPRKAVVRIEVHDTGPGLRRKDVVDNRLFSPYVQTEMGRRQGGKGTGLGLALIRQIVSLSKGRLGVESVYGKGSTFWFELPYPIQPRPPGHQRGDSNPLIDGQPSTSTGSTGISDITAVNAIDTMDKLETLNGEALNASRRHSEPHKQLEKRRGSLGPTQPPVLPLMRQMTAEQFLVSGTSGEDPQAENDSLRRSSSRGRARPNFRRFQSRKLGEPVRRDSGDRQGSKSSLPRSTFEKRTASTTSLEPRGHQSRPTTPRPHLEQPSPKSLSITPLPPIGPVVSSPVEMTSSTVPPVPVPEPTPSPAPVVASNHPQQAETSPSNATLAPPVVSNHFTSSSTTAAATSLMLSNSKNKSSSDSPPKADEVAPLDVLVVDDDKLTRMMMARMLKRLGHRVETAENGQIALKKITDAFRLMEDAIPVDVVFLDNQMPMMTGVEVASRVRELGCPLFIVGCTGNALRQDQDEYIDAGADRILTKPIKQAGIEECILEARRRLRGETMPMGFQDDEEEEDSESDEEDSERGE